jgi:phosphatidylglycerophosphate synthase
VRAVVRDREAARLELAGISLLERMAIALARAGASEVLVESEQPLPAWRRITALGIEVRRVRPGEVQGERVAADGALFALPREVRRAVEARARLVAPDGRPLPLVCEPGGAGVPQALRAESPCFLVTDEASRARAERLLWASLASPADGFADRFLNRPLGRIFAKLFARTPVTPNQITVAGTLLGLFGAALIAMGSSSAAVLGAVAFQLSAAIDCADGEIARVLFKESPLGKWLDLVLDNVVHVAIFAAIAAHWLRAGGPAPLAIGLGVSSVLGAAAAFAVVARGTRSEAAGNGRLAALIDRMTNRDFSLLVLALAIAGRLEYFLFLAGTLSHAFWVAALRLQLSRAGPAGAPSRLSAEPAAGAGGPPSPPLMAVPAIALREAEPSGAATEDRP